MFSSFSVTDITLGTSFSAKTFFIPLDHRPSREYGVSQRLSFQKKKDLYSQHFANNFSRICEHPAVQL